MDSQIPLENLACAVPADPLPSPVLPEPPPPFISFAQNFEDVMLWRALGHIQNGCYIDIGAGEPEADSVTKAFYDRGWSGISVEPAGGPFARLAAARPRDRNLRLLVGDSEGARDFFLIGEENGLSTVVPELAARQAAAGWACRTATVQMTTLARICDQHVRGQIHFLKIDAEWSELAILLGADFARFRPWIVLFEATPLGTGPHSFEDCDRVLEQAGYRFLYADGLNRFWAAEERYAELAPRFAAPPNVFDGFVRAAEIAALARADAALGDLAQVTVSLGDARRLLEQACHEGAAAREELVQAVTERSAWAQELFETNRYAAALTVERQVLLERVAGLTATAELLAQARGENQALRKWLDDVYASTSWKFAWPVRAARRMLLGRRP